MTLNLHNLKRSRSSAKRKKRIGRGNASGHGTFSTRGQKGQRARSGGRSGLKLMGIKKVIQSIPKQRGFISSRPKPEIINLRTLNSAFAEGDTINPQTLLHKGLIGTIKDGVKILGDGEMTKKVIVEGCKVSRQAREKILKNKGQII